MKFLQVTLANGDVAAINLAFVKGMVEKNSKTVINMEDGKTATVRESINTLLAQMMRGNG